MVGSGERGDLTTEAIWGKSSLCTNSSCVEVAPVNGAVHVRDSKRADSPILAFTAAEWRDFISGVKLGEFDYGLVTSDAPLDGDPHAAMVTAAS